MLSLTFFFPFPQLNKLELHDIEEGQSELPVLTSEELDEVATSALQVEAGRIHARMKDMNVDLGAIKEFKRKVRGHPPVSIFTCSLLNTFLNQTVDVGDSLNAIFISIK